MVVCLLQCNEPRTEDAPAADIALSNPASLGRKGFEAGWFELLLSLSMFSLLQLSK